MPSGKPEKKLRADQAQFDAWANAAKDEGLSFNAWAALHLDQAAGRKPGPKRPATITAPAAQAPTRRAPRGGRCSRARFHRRGSYCKFCGQVPTQDAM